MPGRQRTICIRLARQADQRCQQFSLEQSANARRTALGQMARPAPYVGELARHGRDTAEGAAKAGRLIRLENSAALRPPFAGIHGAMGEQFRRSVSKFGYSDEK